MQNFGNNLARQPCKKKHQKYISVIIGNYVKYENLQKLYNLEHLYKIVRGSGNLNFAIAADDAGIGKPVTLGGNIFRCIISVII